MLLVLLESVNRADFKYVFIVWIGRQIREIYEKTLTITTYLQDVSSFIKTIELSFFSHFSVKYGR